MNRTVGTCGACGGRVAVPAAWYATVPPVPACEACGRRVARPWGPVVEMAPALRPASGAGAATAIDCPAVQGEAAEKLQAFLRQSQGQGGGEPAAGEEAGSPVHDNYLETDYFKARRPAGGEVHGQGGGRGGAKETSLRISGPANSTRFTKCCGAAVVRGAGECPACGARVVGGGAPGGEGA